MSDTPDKKRYPHAEALKLAHELESMLRPCVERIQIAGSLRRMKPMVGDIELLFIPRLTKVKTGLFGEDTTTVDEAAFKIDALVTAGILAKRPSKIGVFTWGKQNMLASHVETGIPVDFFSTDTIRWWNALVCRTGGRENNLLITTTAQKRGWSFEAYGSGFHRVNDPKERHDTTSEKDVYEFIGLKYLEPEQRK